MEALLQDAHFPIARFITTTSRPPREGEVSGVQYQFVSREAFQQMIEADTFFEWTEIYGNFYGTNKETLQTLREGTCPIICTVESKGAQTIKAAHPDTTTLIAIEAPREALITRLEARNTSPEDMARRIAQIDAELLLYPEIADIRLINTEDHLEETVQQVKEIILASQT